MNTRLSGELSSMSVEILSSEKEIERWISSKKEIQSIQKIPGDASSRRYYRIFENSKSTMLMVTDPFEYDENLKTGYNYLVVQSYLENLGILVPKVYDYEKHKGFVLIEDLGDQTLLHRLKSIADPKVEKKVYEKAIDLLVSLQTASFASNQKIEAHTLDFNFEKLYWEVGFTIEQFYEKYLGRTFSDKDKAILTEGFKDICQALADEPFVFCHRDYHSRNIMVSDSPKKDFYMIDFQDARMGPCQYDLVSLLKDSYYQLSEPQVEALKKYYVSKVKKSLGKHVEFKRFDYIFDLMTIQRNFKAIGSFASFLNRRGDARYIKFIGNTFENIRRVLLKYPDLTDLREVLFHYYYF